MIVIPARKGSKGLPFKNRSLLEYTANNIPSEIANDVYVLSDDDIILNQAIKYGFNAILRPPHISEDSVSTKELMKWFIKNNNVENTDITLLYLTYPEREWEDVVRAASLFKATGSKSLLCQQEPITSPYLMLKSEDLGKGSQLFKHDLYRRQDYPKCFEISHYVSIFNSNEINNLNNNLYNEDTYFMKINRVIDVDTKKDINRFYDVLKNK